MKIIEWEKRKARTRNPNKSGRYTRMNWSRNVGHVSGDKGSFTVSIQGLTSNPTYGDVAQIGVELSYTTDPVQTPTAQRWFVGGVQVATTATYTPVVADDLKSLRLEVDAAGETVRSASYTVRYAPAVNTVAPVASGNTSLGDVLSTTNGTWTGATGGAYAYQWQRNGVDISGATASSYMIVAEDDNALLRCIVSYVNSGGAPSAPSNEIQVDDFAPPNYTTPPSIPTSGLVGTQITATPGVWSGNPTPVVTGQWRKGTTPIPGATGLNYTPDEVRSDYNYLETGDNGIGAPVSVASNNCDVGAALAAPVISGVPTIDNTLPVVGDELTATPAPVTGNPTPTTTWQWFRGVTPIAGATNQSYTVVLADEGETLSVQQTETNSEGSDDATSVPTDPVGPAPAVPDPFTAPDWTLAQGSGARELDIGIVSLPADNGFAITDVEYRVDSGTWTSLGATSGITTITLPAALVSYDIELRAVNSVGPGPAGDTKTETSGFLAPSIPGVPTIDNTTPQVGNTLTATASEPVTGDPTPTREWEWRYGSTIETPGPSDTYVVPPAAEGEVIRVRQIESQTGGGITSALSAPTDAVTAPSGDPYAVDGISPELVADIANSTPYYRKRGNDTTFAELLSFSAGSDRTYADSNGNLQTVGPGVPRTDAHVWNGTSWERAGMLLEPTAGTNYCYPSTPGNFTTDPLDNRWREANLFQALENQADSPVGANSASAIYSSTDNVAKQIFHKVLQSGLQPCTFSCYLKNGNNQRYVNLVIFGSVQQQYVTFDLDAGVITETETSTDGGIQPVGDGWYYCYVTANMTTNQNNSFVRVHLSDTGTPGVANPAFVGSNTDFLLVDGCQVENTSLPTSLIPTTTGTVARAQETLSVPNTNHGLTSANNSVAMDITFDQVNNVKTHLYNLKRNANEDTRFLLNTNTASYQGYRPNAQHRFGGETSSASGPEDVTNRPLPQFRKHTKLAARYAASTLGVNVGIDGVAQTAVPRTQGLYNPTSQPMLIGDFDGERSLPFFIKLFRVWENHGLTDTQLEEATT